MEWIDESRRKVFEATVRKDNRLSKDLDHRLPDDVRQRTLQIGNELILCYEDALTAIAIATERRPSLTFICPQQVGSNLYEKPPGSCPA